MYLLIHLHRVYKISLFKNEDAVRKIERVLRGAVAVQSQTIPRPLSAPFWLVVCPSAFDCTAMLLVSRPFLTLPSSFHFLYSGDAVDDLAADWKSKLNLPEKDHRPQTEVSVTDTCQCKHLLSVQRSCARKQPTQTMSGYLFDIPPCTRTHFRHCG